jgi:two-component system NtrC family response regulator
VFITGGRIPTGKETVALELHSRSKRCDEPFISLNCATTNPQLLESMLFGHEKGAFTGADEKHDGVFIQADGGTLFLDEIGELPFDAQGLLLRVLEGGGFRRMKGKEDIHVDVRLICATHRNLAQMVAEKKFRADLMYRILGALVSVAPLRKRPEDIITIANHGWYSLRKRPLTDAQRAALASYSWPGNVRELQNFIGRADALDESDFGKLLAEHMAFFENAAGTREPDGIPDRLEELKAWHISRILKRHNGNISDAAQTLGIARSTVRKFSALT